MSTYLLIHGAWHGGWCWRKVAPLLRAEGHAVIAPDLPGHGEDKTPTSTVTLERYVNRVCEYATAQTEPVILLGHSLGGAIITQTAERCPESISALVYMCAFLPRDGESLMTWAQQDSQSLVSPNLVPMGEGIFGVKPEAIHDALYGQCSDQDVEFAKLHLVLQAGQPFGEPMATTAERWGRIPRYYIECLRDRAITLEIQRAMQERSPCRKIFAIDTDHSPFFSAPEQLVDILLRIGRTSNPIDPLAESSKA
jgi:pimeloyl-ACP methyl ester carboxylesterase